MIPDDFVCPLALLPGEKELYQGKALYGQVVLLTTFRLIILRQNSISVIPMRLIESLESINVAGLSVLCKDGTSHRYIKTQRLQFQNLKSISWSKITYCFSSLQFSSCQHWQLFQMAWQNKARVGSIRKLYRLFHVAVFSVPPRWKPAMAGAFLLQQESI